MSDAPSHDPALGAELLERLPVAARLVERARRAGLSLDGAWLVGGAVRDALLARDRDAVTRLAAASDATAEAAAAPHLTHVHVVDLDIAVEGAGLAFAELVASATGGDVIAEHTFGTATVIAPIGDHGTAARIDVASCRTETYTEPGSLPSVRFGATIVDDLARRDVTANAVAVALAASDAGVHAVVDPHGGVDDLRNRLLRVLHDGSFADDPTRIFRVARYSGRLGIPVAPETRQLAVDAVAAGALGTVSADRVRTELQLVLAERAWPMLILLSAWGVLDQLDPRLETAMRRPFLLAAIDEACGDDEELQRRAWTLRLAALARPLGADAGGWMRWLGFPGDVVGPVLDHVHVLDVVLGADGPQLATLRASELYRRLGEVSDDSVALAALAVADTAPDLVGALGAYRHALRETRLTVRGDDVIAAGIAPGPAVGRVLGDLFLRSLDGELRSEADERRALAEHAASAGAESGTGPVSGGGDAADRTHHPAPAAEEPIDQ